LSTQTRIKQQIGKDDIDVPLLQFKIILAQDLRNRVKYKVAKQGTMLSHYCDQRKKENAKRNAPQFRYTLSGLNIGCNVQKTKV
jgi:hypothetical protein